MPFGPKNIMELREEFVLLALAPNANRRLLCKRFGISPPTAYKWINRYLAKGTEGLFDRSRRPLNSPCQSSPEREKQVLDLRQKHPYWGGRKLRRLLLAGGEPTPPACSTITAILKRAGKTESAPEHQGEPQRFERQHPNELWQMDFKGPIYLSQGRCQLLDILDDHSRFCLGLWACRNQHATTVKQNLQGLFERYGLPQAMLMDNGSPWRSSPEYPYSALTIWLIRLGIAISHGRPYHPQTQGKIERFHKTLGREVLRHLVARDQRECQKALDAWRIVYNHQRPHDALDLETPSTRWTPSPRSMPKLLPEIQYALGDVVRQVMPDGRIAFNRLRFTVGLPFARLPVALRPTQRDGVLDVFFCHQKIKQIDLHKEAQTD